MEVVWFVLSMMARTRLRGVLRCRVAMPQG